MSTIAPTAAAEAANDLILDLSTLAERKRIKIDESYFEIRNSAEFGIVEAHALRAKEKQVARLADFDELSDEDAQKAQAALRELVTTVVVDLPAEVLEKLSDHQRLTIMRVWNQTAAAEADTDEAADPTEPPTGEG